MLTVLTLLPFFIMAETQSVTPTADATVNTTTPVFITADELTYSNDSTEIYGKGKVVLRNTDVSIFADNIYVNIEKGEVVAEGNVLALQKGSSIYTDKLFYNTKDTSSYAKNVSVISPPWIVKGAEMKKEGKKTEIENPVFTTCDRENPHYRLQASMINMYQDEKIECWNAVVYLGMIPVIYFPYYSQPLKGQKKPFDFKFGHNNTLGWYVYTVYNTAFNDQNRLSLGFDYMEKIGPKYNLALDYGFGKNSSGSLSGFYSEDKFTYLRRWAGNFYHNQAFNDTTRLNIRATSMSDSTLGEYFMNLEGTDVFRHDYGASFSTSFGNHSIGASISDIELWDAVGNKYYTFDRKLPVFNYTMTSIQLLPRVNYGHSFTFTRSYNPQDGNFYSDIGAFTPSLSVNLLSLSFFSMSASAGLNSAWTNNNEKTNGFIGGDLLNSMTAGSSANIDVLPMGLLRLTGSYSYAKQLNKLRGVARDGITANILNLSATGGSSALSFEARASYDFLTDTAKAGYDTSRFSLLYLRAFTGLSDMYFSAESNYSIFSNMVKNITLNFNIKDTGPSNLWTLYLNTIFINNLIDEKGICPA